MSHDDAGGRRTFSHVGVNLAALAWGLAEATLFFIVPDVLLSWLALDRAWVAFVACLWALVGALVGGAIMYAWGGLDLAGALSVVERVPDIRPAMIEATGRQVREEGALALFLGPLTGTPYKIYALQAGAANLGWLPFLVASVPARLLRFVLIAGIAALVSHRLKGTSLRARRVVHLMVWFTFYLWFFLIRS